MDRDVLLLGVAAVLAGLTAVLVMLGITRSLFVLVVALPVGAAAYFMWYQASGRMRENLRGRAARSRERARTTAGEGAPGGRSRFAQQAREARRRAQRARAGTRGGAGSGGPTGRPGADTGMPPGDARRTLGVDADASSEEVKRAYRERVKETHPDSGGDEEEFKRVNRAYETLKET